MKKLLNTVYVLTPDQYLALDGENLVIRPREGAENRVPLHNINGIITFGCSGASPALMGKCAEYGIELVFLSRNGKFLARTEGEVCGNVLLRRQQYRIADNPNESLKIARNMIAGKIFNSRFVLQKAARDHGPRLDVEKLGRKAELLSESLTQALNADSADTLRGIEGEAAQVYFSVFDDFILQQREDFFFATRSRRPPMDRMNALLSFAYSLETSMCTSALESVGLDPYVGAFHTDRPGRRSLALDLVEEFRAPICDRFVLMLVNKRIISSGDFDEREDGAVLLNDIGRKLFLSQWQSRKRESIVHPFLREKVEIGMLPMVQAQLLARYIRGDLDEYPMLMWR